MCLLLESIKLENGSLCYPEDHEERMNQSRSLLFGYSNPIHIDRQAIENKEFDGICKCRILYSDKIHSVEVIPYKPRSVHRLYLVENNRIEYSYKLADRSMFAGLPAHAVDEDLLIVKNGCITDTTFSNIVFYDGNRWYTPSTFLLNGTQRQRLLRESRISVCEIRPEDLQKYAFFKLINAMLDFDATAPVPISQILPSRYSN